MGDVMDLNQTTRILNIQRKRRNEEAKGQTLCRSYQVSCVSEGRGHVFSAVRPCGDEFHDEQQIGGNFLGREGGSGGEESVRMGEDEMVEEFGDWRAQRSC